MFVQPRPYWIRLCFNRYLRLVNMTMALCLHSPPPLPTGIPYHMNGDFGIHVMERIPPNAASTPLLDEPNTCTHFTNRKGRIRVPRVQWMQKKKQHLHQLPMGSSLLRVVVRCLLLGKLFHCYPLDSPFYMKILYLGDSIDGVIVKVPSPSNAVDRIVSRPGRVKLKTMTLVCVASPPSQHWGVRAKTGWIGIRIMRPSGMTCRSTDCCFSELSL